MSLTASRGIMSVRGYGMFGGIKLAVGTVGVLASAAGTNSLKLYNWSNDTVTSTTNLLSVANTPGGGCGISAFAILPLGSTPVGGTNKYRHANASVVTATNLGRTFTSGSAYGNSTSGLLVPGGSGSGTTATITYQYSNDAVAPGTNLLTPRNSDPVVLGDGVRALISGGTIGNVASPAIDSYTYANNVCASATALPLGRNSSGASGVGNAEVGIFARTQTSNVVTQKYVYAANTTATATSLVINSNNGQGCGNETAGIMMSTSTSSAGTNKYTYAGDTTATGAVISSPTPARNNFVNNGIVGVNA